MNNLLRDIIKIGDVVIFIDDVIIGTKTKKKHNDIMKKY